MRTTAISLALIAVIIAWLYVVLKDEEPPISEQFVTESAESELQGSEAESTQSNEREVTQVQRLPALAIKLDKNTRDRLEPWFAEYRSSFRVWDPIEQYAFVIIDDALLWNLKSGIVDRFRFAMNEKYEMDIIVDSITSIEGGWILGVYLPERQDMSEALLIIRDNGTVNGNVFIMGTGRLIVTPVVNTPYHVIYLLTGSVHVD